MNRLKILRKEIAENTLEEFEFDIKGFQFLVKNFSDNDIFVSFDEEESTDNMIKIPANCSQVCLLTKETSNIELSSDKIYVICENSSADVEIQIIL